MDTEMKEKMVRLMLTNSTSGQTNLRTEEMGYNVITEQMGFFCVTVDQSERLCFLC